MNERFADLAFAARMSAGLTKESAAEMLGVSPRTLSYYESGRKIPDEVVAGMVRAYESPALGYHFLSSELGTGRILLPHVELAGVSSSALRLRVVMNRAEQFESDLESICYDDKITADEQQGFAECLQHLMELAAACIGVSLIKQKPQSGGSRIGAKNETEMKFHRHYTTKGRKAK